MKDDSVTAKWCPGHMGIKGNERANALAKAGRGAPIDRESGPESGPTVAGIRAEALKLLKNTRMALWTNTRTRLSARCRAWGLRYNVRCLPELEKLTWPQLHQFLTVRSGHDDFA